jgi:hypothetical protein
LTLFRNIPYHPPEIEALPAIDLKHDNSKGNNKHTIQQ